MFAGVLAGRRWRNNEHPGAVGGCPLARGMVLPTAALVIFSVSLTFAAGPLFSFTQHAAAQLNDRAGYVTAVFPDGMSR